MQIIPLNLDSVLLLLHNSKLAYYLRIIVNSRRKAFPGEINKDYHYHNERFDRTLLRTPYTAL